MFINTASIVAFLEYLKVVILSTHDDDTGEFCHINHRKLSTMLDCVRKTLDPLIAEVLINTPIEGLNTTTIQKESTMDYTDYNDYCGDPELDAAAQPDASELDDIEAEIIDHNTLPTFVPKEDKMKMNVRAITSIDGRNFHVIPEMLNVEFTNHEELVMMLQAMAQQANVLGYTGVLDHHMLVVTRNESFFEVQGRIIPNAPEAKGDTERYTIYWVYGRQQHIFRTGTKWSAWYSDRVEMKEAVQEKLGNRHSGIIGALVFCGDERMYVQRDKAVKINCGIVRRPAFSK